MKKLLLTLIATQLIAFDCISQTSSDTTCLPNEQLKKVINKLETCKVVESELLQFKELTELQKQRINSKDSIISAYISQTGNYKAAIQNLEKSGENLKKIIDIQKEQLIIRDKMMRRQKLSKYLAAALGLGAGILIAK